MDSQTFFTIVLSFVFGGGVAVAAYAMSIPAIDPKLARQGVVVATLAGLILCVWYGGTNDMQRGLRYGAAAAVAALLTIGLCAALDYIKNREETAEIAASITGASLPGFSARLVISIADTGGARRKYVFDQASPDGSGVSLYLSASNHFTFSAKDIHNETYTIEVPLGPDGLPMNEWIYLLCEVGSSSNAAFLRILVNGKTIQQRTLPFAVDLGSRQWSGTIGTDITKTYFGNFMLAEYAILSNTLSPSGEKLLEDNYEAFYKIKMAK